MRYYYLLILISTSAFKCLASDKDYYQSNIDEILSGFGNKLVLNSENVRRFEPTESSTRIDPIFFTQLPPRLLQYTSKEIFNLLLDALVVRELDTDSIAQLIEALGPDSFHQKDGNGSSLLFHAKNAEQAKVILNFGCNPDSINLFGLDAEQHQFNMGRLDVVHEIRNFKYSKGRPTFYTDVFNYGL